jgi:hypothetical protein
VAKGIKVIACQVMEKEIISIVGRESNATFVQYEYHDKPELLHNRIQEAIECSTDYQCIILGFGLCGGAIDGILAMTCPVIIPKIDDCIPLLLGSRERYEQEKKIESGTYFLNQGWIEYGNDALKDFYKWREMYGERKALWLINEIYKAYTRVAFINSGFEDKNRYLCYAGEVANFLNVKLDVLSGNLGFIRQLLNLEWDNDNYIKLEPGQKAERCMFRP